MQTMMTMKQIREAASALSNQLSAGIPLSDAVSRMAKLQPAHATFWLQAGQNLAGGQRLTEQLDGVWPHTIINSIIAGEQSGSLPEVFKRIEETISVQLKIQGMLWKIAYPAGLGFVGFCVFIFFMVVVLPALSESLGEGERGIVFQMSEWFSHTFYHYGLYILAGITGLVFYIVSWVSNPENRELILDFFSEIPIIGDALQNLYFGLWAYYMALMDAAGGISISESLMMTRSVLPGTISKSVIIVAEEVVFRGLADAVDPDKQLEGDSRKTWPFYIGNAFIIAQQTGRLDLELLRAAPILIDEGMRKMEKTLTILNVITLAVSAILIVGPLVAYYIQLGASLKAAIG